MYKNVPKADNMPHIYAVADQSFNAMMHQKHNQVRWCMYMYLGVGAPCVCLIN